MNPEPGWYHADGDPLGTVRLWNGVQWVGFPQRDPRIVLTESTVQPFQTVRGQLQLKWLALPNQILFGLIAIALIIGGAALLSLGLAVDSAPGLDGLGSPSLGVEAEPEPGTGEFDGSFLRLALLVTMIPAFVFWAWFYTAYKNITRWHHAQYEPFWAIVSWFIPFINLRRPWRMMMELMEQSPDREHEGAINPVLGFIWWFLWLLPTVVTNVLLSRFVDDPFAVAENPDSIASYALVAAGMSLLLNALSTICLVVVITQVTKYQDMRLRPSQAQLEAVETENRNLAAFATPVVPSSSG